MTLDLWENIALKFFLLFCFSFSGNNACKSAGFPEPALAADVCLADYIAWKNKSFVWKGCCQEKKNCVFATLFVERQTSGLNGGVYFSMKQACP